MSTVSVVIYKKATGEIRQFVQGPEETVKFYIQEGEAALAGEVKDDSCYVALDTLIITKKPPLPAVLHDMKIDGVPAGAVITIENVDYTADGQTIELEFDLPGTYTIDIKCFPYLKWSATVEVAA